VRAAEPKSVNNATSKMGVRSMGKARAYCGKWKGAIHRIENCQDYLEMSPFLTD
jgi:hypothetical protein